MAAKKQHCSAAKPIDLEDLERIEESSADGTWGYIGSPVRNYLTDELVVEAARHLGWNIEMFTAWCVSRDGRYALDAQPTNVTEMADQMRKCDIYKLVKELYE